MYVKSGYLNLFGRRWGVRVQDIKVWEPLECVTTGWTTGVQSRKEAKDFSFSLYSDQLWGPPSLLFIGPLPGIKGGRGVTLTTHLI
jgi:hypothetical protein